MYQNKFNMCADVVTLDLNALKEVLGSAIALARNELEDQKRSIEDNISDAIRAEFNGKDHDHFIGLCHANTEREYFIRACNQYSAAIEAYFHVCEAIKRDEVKIIK